MRSTHTFRRRAAVLSGATLLAACLASVSSGARLSPASAAGTAPEVGGNLSGLPVFPADNPWNLDISAAPVDANSANLVASMGLTTSLHPDWGTEYGGAPWGIPYVTVSGSQAKLPITYTDYPAESDPGPFPVPADAPIEGGPNGYGDRHVIVVDRDNARLYELFNAFPTANGWNASCGATFDLRSNALRPEGWTSADAAGLPIFAGLVRYEEAVELGEIRHALRFTAARTRRAYVYPARHYASYSTDTNLPPMGTRMRLKASVDISRYPATAQVVLRALKRYGMILADNGSNWFVTGAPDPRWNDAEIDTLKGIKGGDFEVIKLGYPGAPTATAPAAPANLQVTAGTLLANLSWSPSTGATSYTLKRSTTSGSGYMTVASGLTGTSYTDSSLLAGTTYYYVVAASNSSGASANSAQVAVTPYGSTVGVPAAPTNLKATVTSYVYVTWTAVSGAATYNVRRSSTSGSGYSVIATGLTGPTHFDFALSSGTTYYYVVTAVNSVGESAYSAQVSTSQGGTSPSIPAAPTGLQATAGNGLVPLTWAASSGATSYTLKRSTTNGSGYANVTSGLAGTAYTDTGLSNGTTYFYVVAAVNSNGSSGNSAQVTATPVAPSTGAGTTVLHVNCGGGVYTANGVTWSADQYGSGGATYTYPNRDILGTTEDGRYLSVRYSEGTNFTYALPAAPGNYTLKLHFAECWAKTAGGRVFNVKVNGTTLLSNFDIVAATGANTALVKSFPVTAGSSGLAVLFENVKNGPVVSGIELVPAP